jgi:hypothetical protein
MTPLSKQPAYAKVAQEISDMHAAHSKVLARIAELEVLLAANVPDDGTTHVEAALRFAETGQVVIPSGQLAEIRQEHLILRQQRDAIAKVLGDKQRVAMRIAGELSSQARAEVEPTHRAIAARYLKKLEELDALAEEEAALVLKLESSGYSVNFREYVRDPVIGLQRQGAESYIWNRCRQLRAYVG